MFEQDDFELDDDDFISSSFTSSQPKQPAVVTSKVDNFKSTSQVSKSQQDPFKKPGVAFPKAACFLSETHEKQQRHRRPLDHLANQSVDSNVFNFKNVKGKEPSGLIIESAGQFNKAVKRKFPGPAGILPEDNFHILHPEQFNAKKAKGKSSENHEVHFKQASIFEDGPWLRMVQDFRTFHPANIFLPDKYNIEWIKSNALLKRLIDTKVPFLAAVVQNIQANSTFTSINLTLKDTTGEIQAAILHTLFKEFSEDLTVGSVIVLRQFGVFTVGIDTRITIAPNNLITIYSKDTGKDTAQGSCRSENMFAPSRTNVGVKKTIAQKIKTEELVRQVDQMSHKFLAPSHGLGNVVQMNQSTEFASKVCDNYNVDASIYKLSGSKSTEIKGHTISSFPFNHRREKVTENINLLNVNNIGNCFLQDKCQNQTGNNVSDSNYTNSAKGNININKEKSIVHKLSTNNLRENTFKLKKVRNIFDIDDDFNLTLNEEFGSDMDFKMELSKGDQMTKENNRVNSHMSKTELNTNNSDKNCNTTVPSFVSDFNLTICDDFESDMNLKMDLSKGDQMAKNNNRVDLHIPKTELKTNNSAKKYTTAVPSFVNDFNLTLNEEFGSDMDFKMDVSKGDQMSKENNKVNSHISKTELKTNNSDTKPTTAVPLSVSSTNNKDSTEPRINKVRAALQKFKFKPKNIEEQIDEKQKPETKLVPKVSPKEDQGKEIIINSYNSIKGQDFSVNNSQLSVKTTNVEHNKVWKNLFEDIDTDSLFDDF